VIASGERFDDQKEHYVEYNLRLIEAHYRRHFEEEEEAQRRAMNGKASEIEAEVQEKEERLTLWDVAVRSHQAEFMKDNGQRPEAAREDPDGDVPG
jgi:hypothetical protein